nr:putative G-protein coupled receptor 139 [Biomphalaria glabrata]
MTKSQSKSGQQPSVLSNLTSMLSNSTFVLSSTDLEFSNSIYELSNATLKLPNASVTSNTDHEFITSLLSNATTEWSNSSNVSHNSSHVHYPLSILTVVQKYALPPLLVFGIVTNVLTLLTLRSPVLKQSPYVYLAALAAADLAALVLTFIDHICDHKDLAHTVFRIRVYYPITNMAATVGVNVMLVLTIERCFFVQCPLKAPIKCTVYRARIHIIIIFLFSLFVNLPRFFWYNVKVFNNSSEVGFHIFINYDPDLSKVITWIHSTVHNFIPFLVMIVLNPFLVYKVRQQQKNRRNLGVRLLVSITIWSREQTRLTTVLTAIIFLFIVLVLPSAFADDPILKTIMGKDCNKDHIHIYQVTSNILMWFNFSVSFILYTFMNSKFLKAFKELLSAYTPGFLRRSVKTGRLARQARFHVTLKKECSQTISLNRDSSLSGILN